VLDAVAEAIAVVLVPSYSLTVEAASAEPANVGVLSFVVVPLAGLDITGGADAVVSVNVTVNKNDAVPVLPALSVAEQLTVVVPTGNVEPDAGVQTGVIEPSTRSVADALNVTVVPEELGAATVMSAGTETEGAVVSLTVIVNDAVPVLPAESVAEQFTVVVVIGKVEPDAGVHVAVIEPSTLSVAVTVKLTEAPDGPVASTVIGEGTVSTGGVVSELLPLLDTVTEMLLVPTLPYGSYPLASRVCEPFGTEAVFHEMW
jgi:hypothetical protein